MLQAKINGQWQDVPKDMLPSIPEDGTLHTFEAIHSFFDPGTKKKAWRNQAQIRNPIRVKNAKGEALEIGLINGVDQFHNPLPDGIRRIVIHPQAGQGLIPVTGGATEANELIQFLQLTSENESSPFRDPGVEPVIRTKDFVKDAEKEIANLEKEQEALGIALTAKGEGLKNLALIHGIAVTQSEAQMRAQLSAKAKAAPDSFLALANDPDRDAKAVLAAGLANGSIILNEEASALTYEGNNPGIILKLTSTEREDVLNEWAAFTRDGQGKKALAGIKTLVDKKDKDAAKK